MRKLHPLFFTLFVLAIPLPSESSMVLRLSLQDMVQGADGIVHGRIISQESSWQGQVIATFVEIDVLECHKGPYRPGDRILVYQHGGRVDDLTMWVPGAPRFTTGQEVILFLENRSGSEEPLVLGMSQGKFDVVTDPQTGRRIVTRILQGLELVEQDGALMHRFDSPAGDILLDDIGHDAALGSDGLDILAAQPLWIPLDRFTAEIDRLLPGRESP